MAFVLVLAALPLSLPAASACTYTAVVSVGGPAPPNDGVYLEEGCYFGGYGDTVDGQAGFDAATTCVFVPPVFVAGQQLPGTGRTYCVGTNPVGYTLVPIPDVGVVACAGGRCAWVSTHYVQFACEKYLDQPDVATPAGTIVLDCATY
ncbi:MAG TPA: hypothetical protein VHH36_09245 [Candidatus Thermoplasmatota archaeon]|nr:hypothetical protein [Candidatus Thermoplasmatota archaeon]